MTSNLPATLDDKNLLTVRRLAREGCREAVIRQTLGISPSLWKKLREAEDSDLQAALDIGNGEGAAEVISFMRQKMSGGSMRAAEWLGERVYKLRPPKPDTNDENTAPRVVINLGASPAPNIETFRARRAIEHDN